MDDSKLWLNGIEVDREQVEAYFFRLGEGDIPVYHLHEDGTITKENQND